MTWTLVPNALANVVSGLFLVYGVYGAIKSSLNAPRITKSDIRYEEWMASGHSKKNILTMIGGARNCLRLVVTDELLWVTTWFPFKIFSTFYDLEHVIPLPSITDMHLASFLGIERLEITYIDVIGKSHTVAVVPKDWPAFLQAIGFYGTAQ